MTNPTTVSASIQQCFSVLATSDHDVCEYGNAGLAMVNNSMNQAKNILDSLVKKYDSPYLFHALGDYYALNNQDTQAEQYYMQALQTTDDSEEKAVIQKKIIQLR
jgi:predicted negative regulator of RcsB-dependent stress response